MNSQGGVDTRFVALLLATTVALLIGLPLYYWATRVREDSLARIELLADDIESEAYRFYVLGGSAAMGAPYAGLEFGKERPYGDMGRIAALAFGGRFQGLPISVVNRARSARDSGTALNQARAILRFSRDHDRAALLIYCGNNEFLEYDTEHDLRKQHRSLFDEPLLLAGSREATLEEYERNLEEIVRLFKEAGTFIVLSTVAVNLPEWEPSRSVLADPGSESEVSALLDEGDAYAGAGDDVRALEPYRQALALEPEFAWTWWRLGRALRRLGRIEEARDAFEQACLYDDHPARASTATNAIVRKVAERNEVPLVDAEEIFATLSPDGLAGYDLFWDNCHPRLRGHLALGLAFADVLERELGEPIVSKPTVQDLERELPIDLTRRKAILGWETQYHYVQSCLIWNPAERLRVGRELAEEALALDPDDSYLLVNRGLVAAMQGELEAARAFWERARERDPLVSEERLTNPAVAQILERLGVRDPLGGVPDYVPDHVPE